MKNTFTIVDVETTGLSYHTDRVIEIGATKIVNGRKDSTFSRLIKTVDKVPQIITNITGITLQELRSKGVNSSIGLKEFRDFIGDTVFVAHSVYFDLNFLNSELVQHNFPIIQTPRVDSVRIARAVLPQLHNHKLTTIKEYLKLDIRSHRALEDTEVVWELIKRYVNDFSPFLDDKAVDISKYL